MKKWLRVLGWTASGVLLLLVGSFVLLNTSYVQNKLKDAALNMLSEQLQTSITLDKVSVKFFSQDVELQELDIKDQQDRDMLRLKSLVADVGLWGLLYGEVKVTDIDLDGVEAHLYKSKTDSVMNCQFLIDAFSKSKDNKGYGLKLKMVVNGVDAHNVYATYNNDELRLSNINVTLEDNKVKSADVTNVTAKYEHRKFKLSNIQVELNDKRVASAELKGFHTAWSSRNSRGVLVSKQARLGTLKIKESGKKWHVDVENLRYITNNHQPRKNVKNPHRGFFDVGHMDLDANMKLTVNHASTNSLQATVNHCVVIDTVAGIDIHNLQCGVKATKSNIELKNVKFQQGKATKVTFAHGDIHIHDSEHKISYSTSPITVYAILQDISRPFAPALKNFTMPLMVSAQMSGTDQQININNAVVHTADNQFRVKAAGTVIGFQHGERHQLHVHFNVGEMLTNPVKIEDIIKQFPVKRFMMKQLHDLGAISYTGSFDVLWKKEEFRGGLTTQVGDINFDFTIDGLQKTLSGSVGAPSLEVGRFLNKPRIGQTAVDATFNIDLSNEKAAVRNASGGKLPIGEASAHVSKASYGIISVSNVDVNVSSDGMTAQGDLVAPHKFIDLGCSFTLDDTNDMSRLKIHPRLKVH